ncbi:hypothetical protein D3C81_1802390 [compost metagenome]
MILNSRLENVPKINADNKVLSKTIIKASFGRKKYKQLSTIILASPSFAPGTPIFTGIIASTKLNTTATAAKIETMTVLFSAMLECSFNDDIDVIPFPGWTLYFYHETMRQTNNCASVAINKAEGEAYFILAIGIVHFDTVVMNFKSIRTKLRINLNRLLFFS